MVSPNLEYTLVKKTTFPETSQNSCNQQNFCKIVATISQNFFVSCKKFARGVFFVKNAISVTILQGLARNKLSLDTLRSDNFCISPKSKHNQALEIKVYELHNCWTYFVNKRVYKHEKWGTFWNHMFSNGLICPNESTKWNFFSIHTLSSHFG